MTHDNGFSPLLNISLLLITGVGSLVANIFEHMNLFLSIITKIIPIISFVLYLIINLDRIKDGWKNLFKNGRTKNN